MTKLSGTARIWLPDDNMPNLAETGDDDEVRAAFRKLGRQVFPLMKPDALDEFATGMLGWRDEIASKGVLLHTIVAMPGDEEDEPVQWHVFAGAVDVPETGELDGGVIAERYLRANFPPEELFVENFETRIGWGVGIISYSDIKLPPGAPYMPTDVPRMGVAAALAGAPDSTVGLLVVGICIGVQHIRELAGLVALIATHSELDVEIEAGPTTPSVPTT